MKLALSAAPGIRHIHKNPWVELIPKTRRSQPARCSLGPFGWPGRQQIYANGNDELS
jgi:hypothetical protein